MTMFVTFAVIAYNEEKTLPRLLGQIAAHARGLHPQVFHASASSSCPALIIGTGALFVNYILQKAK